MVRFRVVIEALLGMESESFSGRVFRAPPSEPIRSKCPPMVDGARGPIRRSLHECLCRERRAEVVDRLREQDALAAARKQVLHEWKIVEARVVRLTSEARLKRLGLPDNFLDADDYEPT